DSSVVRRHLTNNDGSMLSFMAHHGGLLNLAEAAHHVAPGFYVQGGLVMSAMLTDGSSYHGQWQNGEPHGHGVQVSQGALRYAGQYSRGVPEGTGYAYGDGEVVFRGTFRGGVPWCGGGEMGAGGVYFGVGQTGKMYGLAELRSKTALCRGRYLGGVLLEGTVQTGQGPSSTSTLVDPSGQLRLGQLMFADGSTYRGTFCAAEPHGMGVYEAAEPRRYHYGQWTEGVLRGPGALQGTDGMLRLGIYLETPCLAGLQEARSRFVTLMELPVRPQWAEVRRSAL
ncbi:MAG: hypothetical protein EOO40_06675, partial [Deltaproteobacteria bacterium]